MAPSQSYVFGTLFCFVPRCKSLFGHCMAAMSCPIVRDVFCAISSSMMASAANRISAYCSQYTCTRVWFSPARQGRRYLRHPIVGAQHSSAASRRLCGSLFGNRAGPSWLSGNHLRLRSLRTGSSLPPPGRLVHRGSRTPRPPLSSVSALCLCLTQQLLWSLQQNGVSRCRARARAAFVSRQFHAVLIPGDHPWTLDKFGPSYIVA
ncbi:hypothetical protein BC628DRAFT_18782 [Trametes gibbosa]|nr:hypothetical protein BC628DRAFT_18782 [Trametes gibbosa]